MKSILCSVLFAIASASMVFAQGTYTQIDYPGAAETYAYGVNNAGDVVGYYRDASQILHGFLFRAGAWSTIDHPGPSQTQLTGINDLGQIVGANEPSGFLYDVATQTFTTVSYPNATESFPIAINNAGTIVGFASVGVGHFIGFYFAGSTYTPFSPGPAGIVPSGISSSNKVVGIYSSSKGDFSFVFSKGEFNLFKPPNLSSPKVVGINPAGTGVVGTSATRAGFLYQGTTLTNLMFPNSTFTVATGVNAKGEVVGQFEDATGAPHGFIWTPSSDAATK